MTDTSMFGRILSSNIRECVVGYRINESMIPPFGSMVRIPVSHAQQPEIYGLVTDIQIEEDGFLRQLATNDQVSEEVMLDARVNRNVPVVLRILFIGYLENGNISHLLPPCPPLTLDNIYKCTNAEITAFTSFGNFGYIRHILTVTNVPPGELLAAHISQAAKAQFADNHFGWTESAINEVIYLMRDNYADLLAILGAIGDADISLDGEEEEQE